MKSELTFFAATSKTYNEFIIPYIFFANKFNKNAKFEIVITDNEIPKHIQNGIEYLKTVYNIDINIKLSKYNIQPQFLRFLLEPTTLTKYTYIGDIDILICEDILNFHIKNLQGFLYDNILREYNNRPTYMSGLHFIKSKEYYKKTETIRNYILKNNTIKTYLNDENMLYNIVNDSHIKMKIGYGTSVNLFNINRPIHGMHLSLNRYPFNNRCQLKVSAPELYKQNFLNTVNSQEFIQLLNYCPKFKLILNRYLTYINS